MQPKQILMACLSPRLMRQAADLCRRSVIDLENPGIEAANRAESRSNSNLLHGQGRLVDQFLGKVQAARLGDRDRSRAEMAHEQPPQMARANSQSFRKGLDTAIFEAAFPDQTQRPRNRVGSSLPARSSRTTFRPAAQTRAESRFRRGRRRGKVAAILLLRRGRGTDRTTIHAAPQHSDVELAIEARIARQPRPGTHLQI